MSAARGDAILAVGVYFADRPTRVVEIVRELDASRNWTIHQAWVALGPAALPAIEERTVATESTLVPKFHLLNRLLVRYRLSDYSHIMVVDDDITLPDGFVDDYMQIVRRRGFALSQPARDHKSYTDHYFVSQLLGIESRETTYVEIGPLFVIAAEAYRVVLPFEDESPMGWGYDFVWPLRMREHGLRMGIIDACPVCHDLRKPVEHYSHEAASRAMQRYLEIHPHLAPTAAFQIVRSYSL